MNSVTVTWMAASHESLIGPPSELINIHDFLRGTSDSGALAPDHPRHLVEGVDSVQQDTVVSECRWVSHINDSITR
jgi:hypothetical protein